MKIDNKIFGNINVDAKEGAYISEAAFSNNGRDSRCSLFIGEGFELSEHINLVSNLLDDICKLDEDSRKALSDQNKDNNTTIKDYVEFHLEEVPDEVREKTGNSEISSEAFIDSLDLCGVGVHIDSENVISLNCDYCIGKDFSDELLVVRFNTDKMITDIVNES